MFIKLFIVHHVSKFDMYANMWFTYLHVSICYTSYIYNI